MPKVNTFNYDTIASWNGSEDLFVVEQPDGTKVATPAMVKQFIEAGDFEATGEVIDGHGNTLNDMAKVADVDAEIGDLSQTGLTGDSVAAQLTTAKNRIAALENIKVAKVSATMTVSTPDHLAIGGYRSVSSTSKVLSTFTGYPTGKTIVAEHLYAFGQNAAILGVVNVSSGVVYLNTATTGDYYVHGYVFYKD